MKKTIDPMKELRTYKLSLWLVFTASAVTAVLSLIGTIVLFSKRSEGSVEAAEWFVRTVVAAAVALDLIIICTRCEKTQKLFTLENMKLIEYLSFIMLAGFLLACIPHFMGNYLHVEHEFIASPFLCLAITLVPEFIANIFKCGIKMQDDLDSIA